MTYEALRAVLRRANARLGTNWTMHDLRHTCALRMARRRERLCATKPSSACHMETTAEITWSRTNATPLKVAAHLARLQKQARPGPGGHRHRSADLAVLFGDGLLP